MLTVQMDKNRPGMSMKPFDIPVLPLMTQQGPAGAFPHASSSVAGISSGLGGVSLHSSAQPTQASQGQYGQPPQAHGVYSPPGQGVAGYSPLGQGQHGQLPQAGQGQYGQPNQAGQGQYGQPNQAGQGQYGQSNQAGQGQYGQPNQAGIGQPNQAGQTSGGFDTYPDMSSNSQPFDGNRPYSGNPTSNGGNPFSQSQETKQQQQQPYQAQQDNDGSYAAYPDLSNGNTVGYGQAGALLLILQVIRPLLQSLQSTSTCTALDMNVW